MPKNLSIPEPDTKEEGVWKILVLDEDNRLHKLTQAALEAYSATGAAFHVIKVADVIAAQERLAEEGEMALILINIVNQLENLALVDYLQEEDDDCPTQVIVCGEALSLTPLPRILNHELDDYLVYNQLASAELLVHIVTALRNYKRISYFQQKLVEQKSQASTHLERERDRLRDEMSKMQSAKVAKLQDDRNKVISMIAHDLRGPFQPLLGYSELLPRVAGQVSVDKLVQMSESINQSAKMIYTLLENLLDWSRMQMGRVPFEPSYLSLKDVVDDTVSLLLENAHAKSIAISRDISLDLRVYADENLLKAVLRNLLGNAIKFTPDEGLVKISARTFSLKDDETPPEFIEVMVLDTGVGISQKQLDKVFNIDVTYTTAGTAQERGTGLGLMLSQEMVQRNGGQIWIKSEVSKGTTVKFTVPAHPPESS